MPYLVDGHNLIPLIPGLSLADLDDERSLIDILTRFANLHRTSVEVFFDRAPPARAGRVSFGRVRAHFVRQGTTADQAIISRLRQLGKGAKNWTVVSSDRVIAAEARGAQSEIISSRAFSELLLRGNTSPAQESAKGENPDISEGEVNYWLNQFEGDRHPEE